MAFIDNLSYAKNDKALTPKRILFVEGNVDGTVGGSYYILYDLVLNLNKSIYFPVVAFYFDNFLAQKLREKGVETYILNRAKPFILLNLKKNPGIFFNIIYQTLHPIQRLTNLFKRFIIPAFQFRRFIKKKKIDLINLNNSVTRNHEWMLASFLANVQCMTHEMGINTKFSPVSKYFAARLKSIITVSYAVEKNMRIHGLDYPHIHTIHNGIDLERYRLKCPPEELRKQFGIEISRPIIGVIGNIKVWKGQETVVRATELIKEEFPEVCCFIIGDVAEGDRTYYEYLQKLCSEIGVNGNVIFTGFVKNPLDFMNMMDIIIHSSIEPEPFGIVNLEAMLVRKPVISTTIGAPLEIFQNNISGVLIEPGNPEALAEACISILKSPEKAKQLGNRAYCLLHDKFTIHKMVEQTENVYYRLLYE